MRLLRNLASCALLGAFAVPCSTSPDFGDHALSETKLGSDLALKSLPFQLSDRFDLRLCQLGARVVFSVYPATPSASGSVSVVVRKRAELQVKRVAAWRVVALVPNYKPVLDRSVDDEERNPTGGSLFAIHARVPISTGPGSVSPRPTDVLRPNLDATPEPSDFDPFHEVNITREVSNG